MQEDNKISQKVLEIVRLKGPVIPTQVSSDLGTTSLLVSAVLSELVSNSTLKISSVKVGGTPLYYAPGQEEKLQNYTKYLHEKEVKAYGMLKSDRVLQDSLLEPVVRVALRNIKDFAVPIRVSDSGNVELFWKWYLLPNAEVEEIIKNKLHKSEERGGAERETAKTPEKETGSKASEPDEYPGNSRQQTALKVPEGKPSQPVPKKKARVQKAKTGDFAKKVAEYFSKNRIEILQKIENRKRSEDDFLVSVPSPVGSIKYYARAKDKKICNEGDLSTAFVQGQNRKMPTLFLTSGKITKKAGEMLQKEFSGMSMKQL